MKTLPTWTVPIAGDHAFELLIVDGRVCVRRLVMVGDPKVQRATIRVATMTPLETCQLGMALQDASRVAGQLAAKRTRR